MLISLELQKYYKHVNSLIRISLSAREWEPGVNLLFNKVKSPDYFKNGFTIYRLYLTIIQ